MSLKRSRETVSRTSILILWDRILGKHIATRNPFEGMVPENTISN